MKQIFTTLLLFACTFSFAQKLEIQKDKLTGAETKTTSLSKLYQKANYGDAADLLYFSTAQFGADYYVLSFALQLPTKYGVDFPSGSKAYLKHSDGDITTLELLADKKPSEISALLGGEGFTIYAVTLEQFEKLKRSPVTFIRLDYSGGSLDFELKPKFQGKISSAFSLY